MPALPVSNYILCLVYLPFIFPLPFGIISKVKLCLMLCTAYEQSMEKIKSLAFFSQSLKLAILKAKAYSALKFNKLYGCHHTQKKKKISYSHIQTACNT